MTIFQKALSTEQVQFLISGNRDTISGFIVNAADVVAARTPEDLFAVHGLGFPGSPWDPAAGFVHVLRFHDPLPLYVHKAMAPEFVDRPPFTGTGFASWSGGVVPLYFLDESAIPAGAELWRVTAGGREDLVAVYMHAAYGWALVQTPPEGTPQPGRSIPSHIVGWNAVWRGHRFRADLVGEKAVLAAPTQPPAEFGPFRQMPRGCWSLEVPAAEVEDSFELLATCTWRGEPFRITDVAQGQDGQMYRVFYTGHNADRAEALGLNKADAGVYWAVVPAEETQEKRVVENHMPSNFFGI